MKPRGSTLATSAPKVQKTQRGPPTAKTSTSPLSMGTPVKQGVGVQGTKVQLSQRPSSASTLLPIGQSISTSLNSLASQAVNTLNQIANQSQVSISTEPEPIEGLSSSPLCLDAKNKDLTNQIYNMLASRRISRENLLHIQVAISEALRMIPQ
jgi:hypothetical protein